MRFCECGEKEKKSLNNKGGLKERKKKLSEPRLDLNMQAFFNHGAYNVKKKTQAMYIKRKKNVFSLRSKIAQKRQMHAFFFFFFFSFLYFFFLRGGMGASYRLFKKKKTGLKKKE